MANCGDCTHSDNPIGSDTCFICVNNNGSNYDPVHACRTCKHYFKKLTEEPCLSCDIRLGNDKWEAKDG